MLPDLENVLYQSSLVKNANQQTSNKIMHSTMLYYSYYLFPYLYKNSNRMIKKIGVGNYRCFITTDVGNEL